MDSAATGKIFHFSDVGRNGKFRSVPYVSQHQFTRSVSRCMGLSIEDDGMGIPIKRYESVFEPFIQLNESGQSDSRGLSLGFSIVRKVAIWHQIA